MSVPHTPRVAVHSLPLEPHAVVPSGGQPAIVVGGLPQGETVEFVVCTVDVFGQKSPYSSTVQIAPAVQAPVIVQPGSGAIQNSYQVRVIVNSEEGAELVISRDGQLGKGPFTVGPSGALDQTLDLTDWGEGTFVLRVVATKNGQSASTSQGLIIDVPPPAPQPLFAEAHDTRVVVKWTRNPQADVVSYEVMRDHVMPPFRTVTQPEVADEVAMPDLALTNGRTYVYQIRAMDGRGNRSSWSAEMQATPTGGAGW